jgi:hypothetical protein
MKFNWVTKDGKHYPVRANSINNPATKNNISIGIIRSDDPNKWTLIPNGSANRQSKQFGLPFMEIKRSDGLKLKKEFGLRDDSTRFSRSYIGDISSKGFKEIQSKAVKVYHKDYSRVDAKPEPVASEPEKTQEIPETILEQLKHSRVNGFPFFNYTGINDYVMLGNEAVMLKNIPRNPNKISGVQVSYDHGSDTYNVYFETGKFPRNKRTKGYSDVYVDQLADLISSEMGVK